MFGVAFKTSKRLQNSVQQEHSFAPLAGKSKFKLVYKNNMHLTCTINHDFNLVYENQKKLNYIK